MYYLCFLFLLFLSSLFIYLFIYYYYYYCYYAIISFFISFLIYKTCFCFEFKQLYVFSTKHISNNFIYFRSNEFLLFGRHHVRFGNPGHFYACHGQSAHQPFMLRQVYLYREEPPPRKRTSMYFFLFFLACNCVLPFGNEVGSQMMVKTSSLTDNKSSVHKHVTHIHIAQHVHIHEQLFNPRRCSESVCEDPPDFTTGLAAFGATSGSQGFFGRVFLGRVSTREKDRGVNK